MSNDDQPEAPAPDPSAEYATARSWFEAETPEYFADTINISTSPYGNSITFGVRGFAGPSPKARVYMSHELALVLSRLLRRILITYEAENDVHIQIPPAVAAGLKLRDEDFDDLLKSSAATDKFRDETGDDH